jgi:tetratricopeptide (TPR) repeat protein
VSLLLDALKRAEQEKQSRQGERPADSAKGRAAPAAAAASAAPSASLQLQPLAAQAAAAASRSAPPSGRIDAEPANTAFHARGAASRDSRRSGVLWAVAGAIVVVILAAGAYVWYSMEALRPQAVARPRPPAAPSPPPASGNPLAALKLQEPPPRDEPASPEPRPEPRKAPRADAVDEMVANLLKENPSSPPAAAPLRLGRTQETARVPAEVAAGYESLRSGDLAAARRSYAAALASTQSLDAELGLATVEARSGNGNAALARYRKVLELDPRNPTALAGLASLADYSQPYALEAELRSDLASHPQSSALHFALGNLYASQSRWGEAQAEFFEAHRLEPASAEVLLNLAVSLDHIGRSRLAAEYYARALEAAKGRAAQFDPAPVERRLAEIGR